MTFAEQVLFMRKKLYLSRCDMAKKMDVTEQTVYRWEQGLSNPNISSRRKFMSLCKKERIVFDENYG